MEKSMSVDWVCRKCKLRNYNWRKKCRKCKEPYIDASQVHNCAPGPRAHNIRPGDWFCEAGLCQAHNFATRQFCFKCGVTKSIPSFGDSVGFYDPALPPVNFAVLAQRVARLSKRGWTTGDWFCCRPECNVHNFGTRVRCYKCNVPRNLVSDVPY